MAALSGERRLGSLRTSTTSSAGGEEELGLGVSISLALPPPQAVAGPIQPVTAKRQGFFFSRLLCASSLPPEQAAERQSRRD